MKIAVDISPIKNPELLAHRVRGTGFYIENLKRSLVEYDKSNTYVFFVRGDPIPEDVDLVHYPYFEPFLLSLPPLRPHKTIITVHDLTPLVFPKYFPSGIRGKAKWLIQRKLLETVAGVITDSASSKKDILKFTNVPEEKVQVVYLAAAEYFKPLDEKEKKGVKKKLQAKYNVPKDFVLYVGDVTWNKNLPRLIKAVLQINLPLVLVGKAVAQKEFDRNNPWNRDLVLVRELIQADSNILPLGFVPDEDLVGLYNIASVFTMPSFYEGFGLPLLEAMACGCPAVTSKNGSLPEIAQGAALYVDSYDIDSIKNGIMEVISNKNLQNKLSTQGIRTAQKFSWKKTAEMTASVYNSIVT